MVRGKPRHIRCATVFVAIAMAMIGREVYGGAVDLAPIHVARITTTASLQQSICSCLQHDEPRIDSMSGSVIVPGGQGFTPDAPGGDKVVIVGESVTIKACGGDVDAIYIWDGPDCVFDHYSVGKLRAIEFQITPPDGQALPAVYRRCDPYNCVPFDCAQIDIVCDQVGTYTIRARSSDTRNPEVDCSPNPNDCEKECWGPWGPGLEIPVVLPSTGEWSPSPIPGSPDGEAGITDPAGPGVVIGIGGGRGAWVDPVTGEFHAGEGSGKAKVLVTRPSRGGDDPNEHHLLPIKSGECQPCQGTQCELGSGRAELGCVDFTISLGKDVDGLPIGDLVISSLTADSGRVASPRVLYFLGEDGQKIVDNNGLRQVLAPSCSCSPTVLVDVNTITAWVPAYPTDTEYTIDIYALDGTPPLVPDSDLYDVTGLDLRASWNVSYGSNLEIRRVIGPDDFDRKYMYIDYGSVGGGVGDPEFFRNMDLHTFIRSGNDWERVFEDRLIWYQPSGGQQYWQRVVQHTDLLLSGPQFYRQSVELHDVVNVSHGQVRTRVVARREEVQGCNSSDTDLTTHYGYYTNGALEYVLKPDGSWVWYNRDAEGRKTEEITPWGDVSISPGTPPVPANNVVTEYSYTPVITGDVLQTGDRRPRTITKKVLGQVVSKTFYGYLNGELLEVVEEATDPNATPGNNTLRTETSYVTGNAERIAAVRYPDGRWDQFFYSQGYYSSSTPGEPGYFYANPDGRYLKTIVNHGYGTASFTTLAGKSTQDVTIKDPSGHVVLEEEYAYWTSPSVVSARVGWTVRDYTPSGQLAHVYKSDGTQVDSVFDCCNLQEYTGPEGRTVEYDYLHEASDFVTGMTRTAVPGSGLWPEVTETYTHDAFGNVKVTTRTGSKGASSKSLETTRSYDKYGRVEYEYGEAEPPTNGFRTDYTYSFTAEGGRQILVEYPNATTKLTKFHRDGRVRSVTGTAVVDRYYTYGVSTDGSQWTRVDTGSQSSARWERTSYDMLGRKKSELRPSSEVGTSAATNYHYNSIGQLARVQDSWGSISGETLDPSTVYAYDELGNRIQTCMDVNRNSTVDLSGTDRISEMETKYVEDGSGIWWLETVNRTYPTTGSGTPVITGKRQRQLTGLGTASGAYTVVVGVSKSIDILGHETTTTRKVNRLMREVEETTDVPHSSRDATKTWVNGLLSASDTEEGVFTLYEPYDELERQNIVTDSRMNSTHTLYDSYGRIDRIIHALGTSEATSTRHDYYTIGANVGRLKSIEDWPSGKKTYYDYNAHGQITRVWGDMPQPVEIGYDTYGQRTSLKTYRSDPSSGAWSDATWPNTPPTADETTWTYDANTGQLLSKTYEDGQQVDYGYAMTGALETRTWARRERPGRITTTYDYNDATGELTSINYSDSTPDVSFTYDRLGRMATATDALGTHTFAYDASSLQLAYEDIAGSLYDKRITRLYDDGQGQGNSLEGRVIGFAIGTDADPDADYAAGYQYDTYGRMERVTGPGLTAGGAKYSYLGSTWTKNLVGQVDYLDANDAVEGRVIRTYEPHRDLLASIENKWDLTGGWTTISKYEYANDLLGRRTSVVTTGTAFSSTGGDANNVWGYNDRNELTGSTRREGTTIGSGTEMCTQYRDYLYDPIGNRTNSTIGKSPCSVTETEYTRNSVNQYTATDAPESFTYDLDGNMTQDGVYTYTYDCENRVIRVEPTTPATGDEKVESVYDYMGRRVRKVVTAWDGTAGDWESTPESITHFVYDGWNLVLEMNGADGADPDTDPDNTIIRKYTWGLDLSGLSGNPTVSGIHNAGGIGGLLAAKQLGMSPDQVYLYDGNGNVSQAFNVVGGSVSAHYEYDPYGNLIYRGGTIFNNRNPFRFSTKYFDKELDLHGTNDGLYYYGYRFYSPRLGRWVNRDPLEERGGNNLYRFGNGAPVQNIDPIGAKAKASGGKKWSWELHASWKDEGKLMDQNPELNKWSAEWTKLGWRVEFAPVANGASTISMDAWLRSVYSWNWALTLFIGESGSSAKGSGGYKWVCEPDTGVIWGEGGFGGKQQDDMCFVDLSLTWNVTKVSDVRKMMTVQVSYTTGTSGSVTASAGIGVSGGVSAPVKGVEAEAGVTVSLGSSITYGKGVVYSNDQTLTYFCSCRD